MRNLLLLIFFALASRPMFCQITSETEERRNWSCLEPIELSINSFADSLNFWSIGNPLPKFIFDANFDLIYSRNDCFSDQKFFSYRRAILKRVINTKVLRTILNSKDPKLDSLYDPATKRAIKTQTIDGTDFPDLPYMTHSTRRMVQSRLDEVTRIKTSFSRRK